MKNGKTVLLFFLITILFYYLLRSCTHGVFGLSVSLFVESLIFKSFSSSCLTLFLTHQ